VLAAYIIRVMMEAASSSETLVNFYQITWRNNPEDSHLYTRYRENLMLSSLLLFQMLFASGQVLVNIFLIFLQN
jgi:hypothetical protein